MPSTTWLPKNNFNRRSFLLANGDTILEPELEETSTGLKIRLAGTKESFYSRDEELLVQKGVERIAEQRKTRYWMPLDVNDHVLENTAGFRPDDTRANFNPSAKTSVKAVAWWSFRHPTMPIKALLFAQWYNPNSYDTGHQVYARLVIQNQNTSNLNPKMLTVTNPSFETVENTWSWNERTPFEEFVRDNPAEWAEVLTLETGLIEREAVVKLLKKVRQIEELEEIEIPDLREAEDGNFDWLTLKLHDTNVTGSFLQDMAEYLDGSASVGRALEIYQEFRTTLRSLGMVLPDLKENEFHRALSVDGDKSALVVHLARPVDENMHPDTSHAVSVHLPTGTFVLSCKNEGTDQDKIAHAWEESRMLAELTGQEDELLAYAREYVRTEHSRRTTKIMDRRASASADN